MGKYYFVYSVDSVTVSGCQESVIMIMDACELADTLDYVSRSGGTVTGVSASMYDADGEFIGDRDITRLLGLKTA